jgi:hypothetical protein
MTLLGLTERCQQHKSFLWGFPLRWDGGNNTAKSDSMPVKVHYINSTVSILEPTVSDSKHTWYWTCLTQTHLMPIAPDSEPIQKNWSNLISNSPDIEPVRYQNCQITNQSDTVLILNLLYHIPNLSDSKLILYWTSKWYRTFLIPNLLDTQQKEV